MWTMAKTFWNLVKTCKIWHFFCGILWERVGGFGDDLIGFAFCSQIMTMTFDETSSAAFTLRVVGSSSKGSFSLRTLLNLQLFNNNSFSKQMTNMRKHTPFSPHDFYLFHVIIQFQADHSVTVCWPDSRHFFLVIVLTWPFNNITVCWPESYHFFWWLCVDLTIL